MEGVVSRKVSVVTPTYGRGHHMQRLYTAFEAQTWADKELVVLDDSSEASLFMQNLSDPRVRYVHEPKRMSVGEKRNRLADMATGELIAHFDDDDYYAPRYLERMASYLESCEMVKLSGWFAWSTTHRAFFYWDTAAAANVHFMVESNKPIKVFDISKKTENEKALWVQKNLVGYGFSYAYTKALWQDNPFPMSQHGEDRVFLQDVLRKNREVGMFADREGLALVVRHVHDSSVVIPQYILPDFMLEQVFGKAIQAYIDG
jgi:glycosyltransferase involved in cell wall biosynthesis